MLCLLALHVCYAPTPPGSGAGSGAQYVDGTTDITRTVHFGEPGAWERECFTRVLQGHIGVATAVFPKGTSGHSLDTLARVGLWR